MSDQEIFVLNDEVLLVTLGEEIMHEFVSAKHEIQGVTDILFAPKGAVNVSAFIASASNKTETFSYLLGCMRTWNREFPLALQICNASMALAGEIAELMLASTNSIRDDIADELGDILYYRTVLRSLMGDNIEHDTNPYYRGIKPSDIYHAVSYLTDVGKKIAFHNRYGVAKTMARYEIAMDMVDKIIAAYITGIYMNKDNTSCEKILVEVQLNNLNKLFQRHGVSFQTNY